MAKVFDAFSQVHEILLAIFKPHTHVDVTGWWRPQQGSKWPAVTFVLALLLSIEFFCICNYEYLDQIANARGGLLSELFDDKPVKRAESRPIGLRGPLHRRRDLEDPTARYDTGMTRISLGTVRTAPYSM